MAVVAGRSTRSLGSIEAAGQMEPISPFNYRRWFAEFVAQIALFGIIWWGWERFPFWVVIVLSAIFAYSVIRSFVRDWRRFWRGERQKSEDGSNAA
jgi:hypothetical protein